MALTPQEIMANIAALLAKEPELEALVLSTVNATPEQKAKPSHWMLAIAKALTILAPNADQIAADANS